MNSAVSTVLNQFLGDWFEGLNSEQLHLSVFSGEVQIGPVRVKKAAVDKLGLPLHIRCGLVKRIFARIPWTSLTSKPLIIEVEDVYILAEPKAARGWNEEGEVRDYYLNKETRLEQLETLNSEALQPPPEQGFFKQLIATIIANIQVKISRLYIRLEDSDSSTEAFALGLVLGKVEVVTCDREFKPAFVQGGDATYKLGKIEDLGVFLDYGEDYLVTCERKDTELKAAFEELAILEVSMEFPGQHRYLLSPTSINMRLTLHDEQQGLPVATAALVLGDGMPIQLILTTPQLLHILKLSEFCSAYDSFRTGIVSKLDTSKWSDEEIFQYQNNYKAWHKAKAGKSSAVSFLSHINTLEVGHSYEEIASMRHAAFQQFLEEQREKAGFKKRSSTARVLKSVADFFMNTASSPESAPLPQLNRAQSDLKAANYETTIEGIELAPKTDNLKYVFTAEMQRFVIVFESESQPLLGIIQEGTKLSFFMRENTVKYEVELGTLIMHDEVMRSPVFPYLFKTGKLGFTYESHSDGVTDIILRAEQAHIICNLPCLLAVITAVKGAFAHDFDIEKYKKAAGETVAGYVDAGRQYMQDIMMGNYTHNAVRLDIDFAAPCALIPLAIATSKECLVIDFGRFIVNSKLVDLANNQADSLKTRDESLLYDSYHLQLKDMRAGVLWTFETVESWKAGKFTPLFSPSPLDIDIGNAISKENVDLPAILMRINLAEIAFHLDDDQLLFLLRLKDQLSEQIEGTGKQSSPETRFSASFEENEQSFLPVKPLKPPEIVIFQHFQVALGSLYLIVEKQGMRLAECHMSEAKVIATVTNTENFICDFYISKLEIEDCRPGVFFKFVLSRALQEQPVSLDIGEDERFPYHFQEVSKVATAQSQAEVCIRVKTVPIETLTEVFAAISDLRLVLSSDFVKEMLAFPLSAISIAKSEAAKRHFNRGLMTQMFTHVLSLRAVKAQKMKPKAVRSDTSTRSLLLTMQVQGLEAWVLESAQAPDSRVVDLYLEAMARYNSFQHYTNHYDQMDRVVRTEYLKIDDEATLDITKIGLIQGYYKNNRISKSSADKEDLLMPCRLEIEYTVLKQHGPQQVQVDMHVEALSLVIGFRDITYFKQLTAAWSGIIPASAPAHARQGSSGSVRSEEVAEEDREEIGYRVDYKCGGLEAVIVDDTGMRVMSLGCLEMHNVSAELQYSPHLLNLDFSSALKLNYYNSQAAVWEPIIEEWAFQLTASQLSEEKPVSAVFTSIGPVNINLSYAMAETVALVQLKLYQNSSQWEKEMDENTVTETETEHISGSQIVYKVKNRLGVSVTAWLEGIPTHSRQEWVIAPSKTYRFSQSLIDNARMKGMESRKRKYACLTQTAEQASEISLEVLNRGVVRNIILNDIGTKRFLVTGQKGDLGISVVVDISSRGGERVVSLESFIKVVNNTDLDLEIACKGQKMRIKATRVLALPMNWLEEEQPVTISTVTGLINILDTLGPVELNNNQFVVLDYAVLTSEQSENEIPTPHQKLIIINPSCTIQNLTPASLSLYIKDLTPPLVTLNPGSVQPLYFYSPSSKKEYMWVLEMEGNARLQTDWLVPGEGLSHHRLQGNFPCDKLSIETSTMMFVKSKDLDLKSKKCAEQKWHSAFMQVYLQFLLVNSTPYTLEFTGKSGHLKVPSHSLGTVKEKKKEMQVRLADDNFGTASDWSRNFNIKTVGVAGSLQLNNSSASASNPSAPNVVQLGVLLSNAGWPLTKTVLVRIQPRFVVANYLEKAVFLRQTGKEAIIQIEPNQALPYQFENAKVQPAVEIGLHRASWSSPFQLEAIEDFQVRFSADPEEEKPRPLLSESGRLTLFGKLLSGENTEREKGKEWWMPTLANDCQRYVRVIISSEDEATLFINFTNPTDPEFQLYNLTDEPVRVRQEGCLYETVAESGKKVPFTYDNHLAKKKRVAITVQDSTELFAIDKIKAFSTQVAGNRVRVVTEGVTRVVTVESNATASPTSVEGPQVVPNTHQSRFDKFRLKVISKGIVLSLIDDIPCERFVASVTGIKLKIKQQVFISERGKLYEQEMRVDIQNLQLDNMQAQGSQFPVMLSAFSTSQDDSQIPFFQFNLEKHVLEPLSATSEGFGRTIENYKHVGLLVQPIYLQVHKDTIMGLVGVSSRLQEAFTATDKHRHRELLTTLNFVKICPELNTALPRLSYNASQASAKVYFEFVNLNAMKLFVSFRSAKHTSGLQIDPREAFGIVSVFSRIGSAFVNITDSPLRFSSVILVHSFQTKQAITWTIAENYMRQGILQFYKILGSVDIIGNPIGLIDKLGTGVFEFFNEPRKGLLKGPKEFAEGIGKGVKSLVSGVISGGFGSVSRITGSLYGVVRSVGGDDDAYDRINRNDNLLEGMYHGVKGGIEDLAEGVAGLLLKPLRGAETGGVGGFFKGVGSGILGAVTAPLSAVLRVGTSVTTGIANTASFLRNGKVIRKGRFRFPRPVGARRIIEPYNDEIAQAQELLQSLLPFKDQKLVFYQRIDNLLIVIITTSYLLQIYDGEVSDSLSLPSITFIQVHRLPDHYLLIACNNQDKIAIKARVYTPLAKLYGVLLASNSQVNREKRANRLTVRFRLPARRCCR